MSNPRKTTIGHYASKAFIPSAIIVSILSTAEAWLPLNTIAFFMTPAAFLLIYAQTVWHRGLCEKCISDMPLNGPVLAEKRRYTRGLFHLCDHTRIGALWLLIAWVPLLFLPLILVPSPWAVLAAFTTASPVYTVLFRHHRVRVWCAQCRWGRGGTPEIVPTTPPSPFQKVTT